MRIVNQTAYRSTYRKQINLTVECILDGVPGTFNQIEDHMNWICQLPYVAAVEVAAPPKPDRSARLIIAALYLRVRAARREVQSALHPIALQAARARENEAWNSLQTALSALPQ